MGITKDRNGMDLLPRAEVIKKRWQEYTELYKKDLNDPNNHNGVITHLEPDILECEVRWASESITSCIRELYNITVLHSVLYKYQWNLIA